MEPQILEEVQKHDQQEVIDFNWEPVRKSPKRYGVLYPVIGYFVSLTAIGSQLKVGKAKLMLIQIGKDSSQAHTYHYQGYSILPKEGVFCKVMESGEVKIGDFVEVVKDQSEIRFCVKGDGTGENSHNDIE
jgi:hypothetical protein